MKKKEKKLKKKLKQGKDKQKSSASVADESAIQSLDVKIKKLKAEIKSRDDVIVGLRKQLKKSESKSGNNGIKERKLKAKSGAAKLLRTQQSARIGIRQKEAWKRHGFLRDRYEYHLENGQEKVAARTMADRDLRDAFGDEAGYSEQELENILS